MGKTTNILLAGFLGISIFAGVCTSKSNKKIINGQKIEISALETKIKKDSIADSKNYLKLSNLLKDTAIFYSDSLEKILTLYNENLSENEKLNKKVSWLSRKIKKDNALNGLEGSYNLLIKDYDSLKNEKDKLFALYQKEVFKNKGMSSENYGSSPFKSKRNFNVKNQNFFKIWKSIPPKLFSVGNESSSFKDNDPENMEAFAVYPGTDPERVEPLKKISDGDKSATFAYPEKFLNEENCIIEIYAIDKNKNESGRHAIYKSGGVISRKEITD